MLSIITANLGTIFVGLVVAAILTLIVLKLVRDRKKGKCLSCDSCSSCPYAEKCHTKPPEET